MTESKIGKYSIVGEIGRGAMGIVYKAVDPYIGRTVAIKTIRFDTLGQGPERDIAQKRFLREAHSAGNLSHPNIVTIFDVGEDQGLSYIAMEYIDGSSLEGLLHARQKFSLDEILRLVEQVAEGLESAHKKGVVHRDIKPANILIDGDGRPRIVDFGIARISTSTITQTNMIMGTPYYMSPEQISGRKVDHRADIFALGAILYELLTGQKAFPGESLTTVIYKIINEAPRPVRSFQKSLPEGLDYVVTKALAKTPEERYQSCRELVHDLRNYAHLKVMKRAPEPEPDEDATPAPWPIVREPRPVEDKPRRKVPVIVWASLPVVAAVIIIAVIVSSRTAENPRTPVKASNTNRVAMPQPKAPETPAVLLYQGQKLMIAKKYGEALAPLLKVPESAPQYFQARLWVASVWEAQDKLGAAASEYRKLINLDSKDARPYLRLAELLERKGDLGPALEYYRKYVEVVPESVNSEAAHWKIKTLEARVSQASSSASNPGAGQTPQARTTVPVKPPEVKPAAVDKKPEEEGRAASIRNDVDQAVTALRAERYAEAITLARRALALDPNQPGAKKVITTAVVKAAPGEVRALLDSYLQAVKKADLKSFYSQSGTPEFYQRIKKETEVIFKSYDEIQVTASGLGVNVKESNFDQYSAEASFFQIITARNRDKGPRQILFDGQMTWTLKNDGGSWKISEIAAASKAKK